jgi:hypothetical protein
MLTCARYTERCHRLLNGTQSVNGSLESIFVRPSCIYSEITSTCLLTSERIGLLVHLLIFIALFQHHTKSSMISNNWHFTYTRMITISLINPWLKTKMVCARIPYASCMKFILNLQQCFMHLARVSTGWL